MGMGLNLGLGLGSRQQATQEIIDLTSVWTCAITTEKSFIIGVTADTTITSTGGTKLRASAGGTDLTSLNLTANTITTVYFISPTSGTIVFPVKSDINYINITNTAVLSFSINGMALTTLRLTSTGTSITGSINGMALTYLLLSSAGTSITGSINGMPLTFLQLTGAGTSITGSINGMALTFLQLTGTGTSITGSINGMALTYLLLTGTETSITGSVNGMALKNLSLSGTGTSIIFTGKTSYNTMMSSGFLSNNSMVFASKDDDENRVVNPSIVFLTGGNNKTFEITSNAETKEITVQLATNGTGTSTTTANDIVNGWNQSDIATVELCGNGLDEVPAMSKKPFVSPFGNVTHIIFGGTGETMSILTKAQYRQLFIQAHQKLSTLTTFSIADADAGRCPEKSDNDLSGSPIPMVDTAYTAMRNRTPELTTLSISTTWQGIIL